MDPAFPTETLLEEMYMTMEKYLSKEDCWGVVKVIATNVKFEIIKLIKSTKTYEGYRILWNLY